MEDDIKNTKTNLPAGPGQARKRFNLDRVRQPERNVDSNERDSMFARLQEIVLDGLRHGFFDCFITCELVNERKRRVIIKAGKSHQFTIREEDLQS
jgi:hypothetical protein